MKKRYIVIGLIIVVVAIGSIDIIGGNKAVSIAQTAQTIPANLTQESLIGKQAPDFTLTAIDGKQYRLQDMQGKVVILFGMAGWCGECLPEGQALSQIQHTYGNKVQPIGVAFTKGDNKTLLGEYQQTGKVTIPLAVDTDNVGHKYNLTQLDTTYIINKQGIITFKSEQSMTYNQIKQQLDKII